MAFTPLIWSLDPHPPNTSHHPNVSHHPSLTSPPSYLPMYNNPTSHIPIHASQHITPLTCALRLHPPILCITTHVLHHHPTPSHVSCHHLQCLTLPSTQSPYLTLPPHISTITTPTQPCLTSPTHLCLTSPPHPPQWLISLTPKPTYLMTQYKPTYPLPFPLIHQFLMS